MVPTTIPGGKSNTDLNFFYSIYAYFPTVQRFFFLIFFYTTDLFFKTFAATDFLTSLNRVIAIKEPFLI